MMQDKEVGDIIAKLTELDLDADALQELVVVARINHQARASTTVSDDASKVVIANATQPTV